MIISSVLQSFLYEIEVLDFGDMNHCQCTWFILSEVNMRLHRFGSRSKIIVTVQLLAL